MRKSVTVSPEHPTAIVGWEGESQVTEVIFDIGDLQKTFGPGAVQLKVQRAGDQAPYPAAAEVTGSRARWTLTAADLARPGYGEVQLLYVVGEQLAKSQVYRFYVKDALGASEGEPDPALPYFEKMAVQADRAIRAAEAAAVRAEAAAEATATDPTLTQPGRAADAGAAGDAIRQLQAQKVSISDLTPAAPAMTQPVGWDADNKKLVTNSVKSAEYSPAVFVNFTVNTPTRKLEFDLPPKCVGVIVNTLTPASHTRGYDQTVEVMGNNETLIKYQYLYQASASNTEAYQTHTAMQNIMEHWEASGAEGCQYQPSKIIGSNDFWWLSSFTDQYPYLNKVTLTRLVQNFETGYAVKIYAATEE